ncbi:MAG: exosortase-associated EpsI family protein, partial [Patescibacteria group bacterium]|nr:exosortase-associated EpsI family protein [Patescibacteria group bacterium]
VVSDREYTDREDKVVSAHTALFTDFDEAIIVHLPSRCYSAAGWNLLGAEKRDLVVPGVPPVKVEISTWEFEGLRVKVLYWYQLGEHTVLDRFDLSKARMAFAGHKTWPAMVKVMLQTSADQGPAADVRLLDVARNIRQWLYEHGGMAAADTEGVPTDEPADGL